LSCDYEDRPDFYKQVWKKANKEHRCCECGYTVKKGEVYEHVTSMYDGSISTFKTYERCVDLRDSLGDCYQHRGLFEDYSKQLEYRVLDNREQVQKVLDLHRSYK
jgi:hypothetical protein